VGDIRPRSRWARFCNWLEAEPWRWNYAAIWRGIQADAPWWRRAWWAASFPHVHHEDDDAGAAERVLAEVRLYGEKMTRDREPLVRSCGADLLQIIDNDAGQ
jgi:hypothetical protein